MPAGLSLLLMRDQPQNTVKVSSAILLSGGEQRVINERVCYMEGA